MGTSAWMNQGEVDVGVATVQGSTHVASSVKQKSPPELNAGVADLGGLFGGRGIAAARNLMASVGMSRAGERPRSALQPPPSVTRSYKLDLARRMVNTPQVELFE